MIGLKILLHYILTPYDLSWILVCTLSLGIHRHWFRIPLSPSTPAVNTKIHAYSSPEVALVEPVIWKVSLSYQQIAHLMNTVFSICLVVDMNRYRGPTVFIAKNLCISGPTQFKPVLFKDELICSLSRNT